LVDLFEATYNQDLDVLNLELDERSAATIMLVSGGYPEDYEKDKEIYGLDNVTESIVFHAGTAEKDGKVVTNGGRVLAITTLDSDFREAIKKSYKNIEKLSFNRMNYRTDIGFDL